MSHYWFNRENRLKNAWDKYHNKGGKEKTAKYYIANRDVLREDQEISIETCQKKKRYKKELSKRKIPHEY